MEAVEDPTSDIRTARGGRVREGGGDAATIGADAMDTGAAERHNERKHHHHLASVEPSQQQQQQPRRGARKEPLVDELPEIPARLRPKLRESEAGEADQPEHAEGAQGAPLREPPVDAILEEAVQSLPEELPFLQVDRIEYMNAHRREEEEAPAASDGLPLDVQSESTVGAGRRAGEMGGAVSSASIRRRHAHEAHAAVMSAGGFNLTLVTQTGVSRLHYLAEGAARFRGPIAAAVLLPSGCTLVEALGGRTFEPHVTLLPVDEAAAAAANPAANGSYPINLLRNTALRAVRTTHFLVLDVDLWPSSRLYEAAMRAPVSLLRRKYAALVVPAFELDLPPPTVDEPAAAAGFYEAAFDRVPTTTPELRACLEQKQCATFYAHTSAETHSTTPYAEWWQTDPGAEPLPITCFKNARYEPYVVLPNLPSTPLYSEAFTGYGKNKIELVTHLRFAGFKFYALPSAFVVHMPHVKSEQKVMWEVGGHHVRMDRLYQKLVAQLIARFKRPRTPSCHPGRLL